MQTVFNRRGFCAVLAALLVSSASAQTTFDGTLTVKTTWQHLKTSGSSTLSEAIPQLFRWNHQSGTNSWEMNALAGLSATLAARATNTVSLGALVNGFGDTVGFSRVAFLSVSCASNSAGAVAVGGAPSDAFSAWCGSPADRVRVLPGGIALFVSPSTNGYAVGSSTNLMFVNESDGPVTFDFYAGGVQ